LALGAGAADAQVVGPYRASDLGGPYVDAPYRGGPYYAPPPAEFAPPPPQRYGYGGYGPGYAPGYAPAALVPPHEVYSIIREAGFSPLGVPQQRGFIYTIAVIDRGGEDRRLVIDARSGRILRFVPAWQNGASYEGARNSAYGPSGPLPPAVRAAGGPRPPASVPHVASRSVPVPKPSPLASKPAEAAFAKSAPVPPTQQAAAAQAKPADSTPATTGTIGQSQTGPSPTLMPTQDMPKAQGLE